MPRSARHLRAVGSVAPEDADALLALVARGDRQAYAQLFDLLAPTVLGLCRRVVRDPAQAEEVAQEVLLEVWRKAPSWDPARSARGWVAMIAHRRAVDRVRSEQAERDRRPTAAAAAPARSPADPVAEEVADRADRDQVGAALAQLTGLQRQTVELAYFEGHTYREVAEILDLPLGTVKTRIRDGLIRLRDALGTEP